MKINEYGEVILTPQDAFTALYSGKIKNLENILFEDTEDLKKFNDAIKNNWNDIPKLTPYIEHTESLGEFDKNNQTEWFMPEEYKVMDIEGYLVHVCPKQNYDRLITELQLFRQHNMIDVLRYLKYFVDTMRANNIVWGVGRGSSVASYCLYLLGVHKIDSIKYKLDIKEFLK